MSDQQGMPASTVQWLIGSASAVVGFILSCVGGVLWARQNALDAKIEAMGKTMWDHADAVSKEMADHALDDEQKFARKDSLREAFNLLRDEIGELKENQGKNRDEILARLDRLIGSGRRQG